jgi:hypothetical protein
MRRDLIAIGFGIILGITALSGCQETQIEGTVTFEGVTLESDVVELFNASLKLFKDDYEMTWKAEVKYLFHNIAGRIIDDLEITVEFYDENDNLLTIRGPKHILSMPADYTEAGFAGTNIVQYTRDDGDGENVYKVNHVRIVAVEVQ